MKYYVITRNKETDTFEFHNVEANDTKNAIEKVNEGITVVSKFFKKNYNTYNKLWNKLDKHYQELDTLWKDDSKYKVLNKVLDKDNVMYSKNDLFFDDYAINIYDISDYQFEQLILTMKENIMMFN